MMDSLALLTLLQVPRLGRKSANAILQNCLSLPANITDLLEVVTEARGQNRYVPAVTEDDLKEAQYRAERLLESAVSRQISAIPRGHSDFPSHLSAIPDPPVLLWVHGDYSALKRRDAIAIIGTREPTDYGLKMAERLGAFYGERGVVVSGLALGCDTAAHRGCLSRQGVTIAFLAQGLDRIYPSENTTLAQDILDAGGCLVSEYAIGETPRKNYFVERDRLQSAQSGAVLVIETDTDGGTMHTVRFCEEQGRILACLQHPPGYQDRSKTRGNRSLIVEGRGIPIQNTNDLESLWIRVLSANGALTRTPEPAGKRAVLPNITSPSPQLALFEEA